MAHSAAAAARTRLASSRASSPHDDNTFATATATSFKDAIHSTPQREYNTTDEDIPLHHDQSPEPSEVGSDGSADMSIELGRGLKRSARKDHDVSSDIVFNFGKDNSQYDIMGTPPVRPRRADGTLRKEASVRRATESARANESLKKNVPSQKQRAVSDNVQLRSGQPQLPAVMATVRSSRFVSSRNASANYGAIPTHFTADGGLETAQKTPRQHFQGNATVQSTVHTLSQSFVLPDFPDITELVSGMRKDGTPLVQRGNAVRSRFASGGYKPLAQDHAAIEGISLPEDEKAIFVSLQHAREKNARLESEHSEAQKRIEELELQVSELRHQLQRANRRSDSALGSEDDTLDAAGFQMDKARWQGKIAALQERLSKSERKNSVAEITSTRIVKERDGLVTQIATVYFQNEELSKENDGLRATQTELSQENEALKNKIDELLEENAMLKDAQSEAAGKPVVGAQSKIQTSHQQDAKQLKRGRLSKKAEELSRILADEEPKQEPNHRRRSSEHHDSTFVRDLAFRIEREVRKMREGAASSVQVRDDVRDQRASSVHSRSGSRTRNASTIEDTTSLKRHISSPTKMDIRASDSTQRLEKFGGPTQMGRINKQTVAQEDLTELSVLDPDDVANLRRKLEEEKRSGRLRKRASSKVEFETDDTSRSASRHTMPRKSSLKDMTGGTDNGTGQFSLRGDDVFKVAKSVRVQSPHSSQDILEPQQDTETGNMSMLSNTSRRRRRTSDDEGMTSAFIVPDITLHGLQMPTKTVDACIGHNAAKCTLCAHDNETSIPKPVPASERDLGDVTDATVRPSQAPDEALAMVIKNLEDEIKHLKLQRESQNRLYNQHEPAISKRRRQDVKATIDVLTAQIEKRSDQVYALYDVIEGQKQQAEAAAARGEQVRAASQEERDETLESIGIDPLRFSGHVGRKAPVGLDDVDDLSEESVWEGLSDISSEEEVHGFGRK